MIARTWRGAVRARDAEKYVEYLKRTGFAAYAATAGNRGVLGLRRTRGDRAEFLLVSLWDSQEAIQRFAGADADRAVFYPEDEDFLVERDEHVDHFGVIHLSAPDPKATDRGGKRGSLAWLADLWAKITAMRCQGSDAPEWTSRGWKVIRLP